MDREIISFREQLLTAIKDYSQNTERLFLSLAEEYPKLLTSLEESIIGSSHTVDRFANQLSSKNDSGLSLDSILHGNRNLIEEASAKFINLHTRDDQLFTVLNTNIEKIDHLKTMVGEIRKLSEEMELISLNAMTTAIKAGKEGGAFSFITEELKRLSEQTIQYTEKLSRYGDSLQDLFLKFKGSVGRVEQAEKSFSDNFKEIISRGFDAFTEGLNNNLKQISSINVQSTNIREPLLGIMQEIQHQDIIKQSLDHVLLSLNQLKEIDENGTSEAQLDEIAFLNNLSELCILIVRDVNQKLKSSLSVFNKKTEEVESLILSVEEKRKDFINESLFKGSQGNGKLVQLFQISEEIFNNLSREMREALRHKERIHQESYRLMKQVRKISEGFTVFSMLIARFHNINVASKIEVAKQKALIGMTDTVREMTELTEKIEINVEKAQSTTREFLKTTQMSIRDYENIYKEEELFIDEFDLSTKDQIQRLKNCRDTLSSILNNFQIYSKHFYSHFSKVKEDLGSLEKISDSAWGIIETLEVIQDHTALLLKNSLIKQGSSSWEIKNEKLKTIINGFTIYTHKKVAGDLGGFEVEGGTEEGEVTFF